jgi:nucleoside-diphosphate-sugar epimerase
MIFISGATGMIGAHIAFALTAQGHTVRAMKRKGASVAETEKIFRFYSADADTLLQRVEWVDGDILDLPSLEEAMQGATHVYHSAAMVSFVPRERDRMVKVNGEGTANMINVAMFVGVKKFCHISSVAALGRTRDMKNIGEETWWKNDPANSWYAISKYAAEREAWRATEEGMDVIILNPAVVIGPGSPQRSSNAIFALAKKGFSWYTSGSGGFVDARDVADAAVKLMESNIVNQRFVLNAKNMTYRDFADRILKRFGHKATSREVGAFLTALMWRAEKLAAFFTGKTPRITKESAAAAREAATYTGAKITEAIGFTYRDVDTTLDEVCGYYK